MPKISVCIPTYNSGEFLSEAIQSVLDQSFQNFELIISDNASEDNTTEIVNAFNDSRIQYYRNKKNIGMYENFNHCLDLAEGEYIKFLCATDYLVRAIFKK